MVINFALIFGFLALGVALARIRTIPRNTPYYLNQAVLYISLPATLIVLIPKLHFSSDLLLPVLLPLPTILVTLIVLKWIVKVLRFPREIEAALMLTVPLGNTSFVGFPLIEAYLGESALGYAIIYDQIATFLFFSFYTPVMIALYGGKGEGIAWGKTLRRIVSFPPFMALCVALVLTWIGTPDVVMSAAELGMQTLIPFALTSVGFQMIFSLPKSMRLPFGVGLGLKMVLMPLIVMLLCMGLGRFDLAAQTSIMQAAMPPMITAGLMAIAAGFAPRMVAAMVGYGIVLAFVNLTLLKGIFQLL